MIEGLDDKYLRSKQMAWRSPTTWSAPPCPGSSEWGELDLNYHVVAEIERRDSCIGCQTSAIVACHDGAHQCIHQPGAPAIAGHVTPMAGHAAEQLAASPAEALYRVPWVDETECVGCNLCALVCPVEGCIEMAERRRGREPDTWNDRVASGRDHVPGGLDEI